MKKIGIVSRMPLFEAPYLDKYFKLIKNFDLIIWERYAGLEEQCENANRIYAYNEFSGIEWGMPARKKIIGYIAFSRYVKKILKNNNYDVVIFFDLPIPILISHFLVHEYQDKYIIDIRDVRNYFTNKLILKIEKSLANNALAVVGTSPGHAIIVENEEKFYLLHNDQDIKNSNKCQKRKEYPIIISFIGTVRFYDEDLHLIRLLKNDSRYKLKFIGRNSEYYSDYLKINKIKNVELIGEFKPQDINNFFSNTNLIMNLYGNKSDHVKFALSNKLYFSARNRIPILVNSNTYMAKIVKEYGLGIVIDYKVDDVKEKIQTEYGSIDWKKFEKNCEGFIKKVEKDNTLWSKMIVDCCN